MKKLIFVQLFIAASALCGWAQLKVSSAGNVGIKLPNATDVPLSPLSIGGVGSSTSAVSFTGDKSVTLDILSTASSSTVYGIRSKVFRNSSMCVTYSITGEALAPSGASQSYGIGVGGRAGGYDHNYGIVGNLSDNTSQGTAVFGSITPGGVGIPSGRYAGYFDGNVVVTGTINGVNLSNSDESYKQNIAKLETKTLSNKLLLLNPVSYNLKQQYVDGTENGKTKQIPISQRGEGSQLISGSEFDAGIYLYALIADGQKAGIKQMILTE